VATRLQPLLDQLVFVGGQVTELLITDPVAPRLRPTDDVDAICEAATRLDYHQLGERLKELGFAEDMSPGAPMCRWRAGTDVIDVMPADEEILHFKGDWYPIALRTAQSCSITDTLTIRIASAPAFLATKWEAFTERGEGDWYSSHDVEDIIMVVAGRPELLDEIDAAEPELREFLIRSTASMFDAGVAEDVIAGALPETRAVPGLLSTVMATFEQITLLGS
jgi:hypothetical protein